MRPTEELEGARKAGPWTIAVAISRFVKASEEPVAGLTFAGRLSFGVIAGYSSWWHSVTAQGIVRRVCVIAQLCAARHNHSPSPEWILGQSCEPRVLIFANSSRREGTIECVSDASRSFHHALQPGVLVRPLARYRTMSVRSTTHSSKRALTDPVILTEPQSSIGQHATGDVHSLCRTQFIDDPGSLLWGITLLPSWCSGRLEPVLAQPAVQLCPCDT